MKFCAFRTITEITQTYDWVMAELLEALYARSSTGSFYETQQIKLTFLAFDYLSYVCHIGECFPGGSVPVRTGRTPPPSGSVLIERKSSIEGNQVRTDYFAVPKDTASNRRPLRHPPSSDGRVTPRQVTGKFNNIKSASNRTS